ncbi:MAG: Uma2 family endonuclease [Isosphaeraceae bacterium]
MATAAAPGLTAEQFGERPDPGYPEELVRGRVVRMPPPNRRHGQVCSRADRIIGGYVDEHDLGHVLSNDSGVITGRDPDTVRGADVAYYSFARLPRGPLPQSYGPEAPELVVEVLSPGDRWPEVLEKLAEYLRAGVVVVLVLDPETRAAQLYRADQPPRTLQAEDELTLPDVLGDFRAAVARFFD